MRLLVVIVILISFVKHGFSQDTLPVFTKKDSVSKSNTSDTLKNTRLDTSQTTKGIASFYHHKFNGRKTSSGEIFQNNNLTAAHKTIKLGTYVKVRCLKNDSTVIVKVNDRLPPRSKRSIDLTTRAAKQLNFIQSGLTKVEITVLDSLPNN